MIFPKTIYGWPLLPPLRFFPHAAFKSASARNQTSCPRPTLAEPVPHRRQCSPQVLALHLLSSPAQWSQPSVSQPSALAEPVAPSASAPRWLSHSPPHLAHGVTEEGQGNRRTFTGCAPPFLISWSPIPLPPIPLPTIPLPGRTRRQKSGSRKGAKPPRRIPTPSLRLCVRSRSAGQLTGGKSKGSGLIDSCFGTC